MGVVEVLDVIINAIFNTNAGRAATYVTGKAIENSINESRKEENNNQKKPQNQKKQKVKKS